MRTYIDDVVKIVEQATHVHNKDLLHLYGLLVLTKGEEITLKDVHDAWSMSMNYRQKTENCWGHDHKSIVPFEELDSAVAAKDWNYVRKLRGVAKQLRERSA